MDEPVAATDAEVTVCPNCGASVAGEASAQCAQCQGDLGSIIDWEEPARDLVANDELDGMRIRKLVQGKRSAIRARTYAVVIFICCIVMGVQLILTDVQEVHLYGWDFWANLYAICAAAMAIGATVASRKAAELNRESQAQDEAEPADAPQFDALSDGSQHAENLAAMHDAEPTNERNPHL